MKICVDIHIFLFIWISGQENENEIALWKFVSLYCLWLSAKFEQCLVLNSTLYFDCMYPHTL